MKSTEYVTATLLLATLIALEPRVHEFQKDGSQPAPQAIEQSSDKLQQLVAPIALYSDSLIAQILNGHIGRSSYGPGRSEKRLFCHSWLCRTLFSARDIAIDYSRTAARPFQSSKSCAGFSVRYFA